MARTVDGRRIAYEDLSAGAAEQLAMMVRVAATMLVSPEEGVPLLIDDDLGFTDRDRLEAMGTILARAGRERQVIVLTCDSNRFGQLGEAKFVRFEGC